MALQEMTQGNGATEADQVIEFSDAARQRMEDGIRAAQQLEHDRDMLKQRPGKAALAEE